MITGQHLYESNKTEHGGSLFDRDWTQLNAQEQAAWALSSFYAQQAEELEDLLSNLAWHISDGQLSKPYEIGVLKDAHDQTCDKWAEYKAKELRAENEQLRRENQALEKLEGANGAVAVVSLSIMVRLAQVFDALGLEPEIDELTDLLEKKRSDVEQARAALEAVREGRHAPE